MNSNKLLTLWRATFRNYLIVEGGNMKIIRVENCYECPKINNGLMVFGIKRCGITGRVIDNNLIPKECPLEDEKLRYVAYNEIEGFKVIEEYDCPIHGKLGGIDECPLC